MKKALTHIFVFLVNFYFLGYLIGLVCMTATVFNGPLPATSGVFAMCIAFGASLIYQFVRKHIPIASLGEMLVSNSNKSDIMAQTVMFSVSRIPLFILVLITLAISGNLLDGLSEGRVYVFGNTVLFGALTICTYLGMKNFILKPDMTPILLLISGLMLNGFAFKHSTQAELTGEFMFYLYVCLSALWLVLGYWYKQKQV